MNFKEFNLFSMEKLQDFLRIYGTPVVESINTQPLWIRLSVGAICLSMIYLKKSYGSLNDSGVEVLTESGINFELKPNGALIMRDLLFARNLKTVGYYTMMKRRFATIDDVLIKVSPA